MAVQYFTILDAMKRLLFVSIIFIMLLSSCSTNRWELVFDYNYKLDKYDFADYSVHIDSIFDARVTSVCITPNSNIAFEVTFTLSYKEELYILENPFVISSKSDFDKRNLGRSVLRSSPLTSFQLIQPNKVYTQIYKFPLLESLNDTVDLIFRTYSGVFNIKRKNVLKNDVPVVIHSFALSDYNQ
jgi:hypothetical protein